MNVNTKKTFYYHADASALGGVLTQPLERIVSTPGSVSLAQAGGHSIVRTERFELDGLITFESAQVSVSGIESREDGGWRTVTTAVLERLNILHVVTADRIVAQLSVMHFHDERPAEISFNGSQYVNLRLNGALVEPKLNHDLLRRPSEEQGQKRSEAVLVDALPRFNDLLINADRQYAEAGKDGERTKAIRTSIPRFAVPDPREELERKGSFLCSLVKEAAVETPATAFGHQIHVPDFGNIFLGELRVNLFSAQLTMVRAEMGCIANGIVSVGTVGSNGSTMP
jgi:hypothetical protein